MLEYDFLSLNLRVLTNHGPTSRLVMLGPKDKPQSMFRRIYSKLVSAWRPNEPQFMARNPRYAAYEVGEWTYGNPTVLAWDDKTKLRIGRFCSIAEGVTFILGGNHRTDWVTTYPFNVLFDEAKSFEGHPTSKGDINVDHDVWIGKGAAVLSGVSIGDGAVVAAYSVVTKNVPPYGIVAGNPARLVRLRFRDAAISKLQEIAWWNWPMEQIHEAWPLLLSPQIEPFIARYGASQFDGQANRFEAFGTGRTFQDIPPCDREIPFKKEHWDR